MTTEHFDQQYCTQEINDMHQSIAAIIPAYNAGATIATAIKSVLDQVEPPEEVIVVDDGSTDSTAEVVQKFGSKVRLIRQTNRGAAVARQTGTNIATCDYIAYLDADDWWPQGKIARCREIVAAENVYFMLADLQRAKPGDEKSAYLPKNSSFFPWARKYLKGRETKSGIKGLFKLEPKRGLSLLLQGFPVFPSTMLVKRSAIEDVGGWDERFIRCQDFDIGLRIARRFPLHYMDEVQAILGLHEGNQDKESYVIKQTLGDINVLKAHIKVECCTLYGLQVKRALGRKLCGLGYQYRIKRQYSSARTNYKDAFKWPGMRIHALIRLLLLYKF